MKILKTIFVITFYIMLVSCQAKDKVIVRPVDKVYPQLDAVNSRWFFFSSATRPFGMVNLSPDTQVKGAWDSGYSYNIDTIKGFSHIHGWQISGVSVMPIVLDDSSKDYFTDYYSKFSHENEIVEAGYHKVELERYNIVAELTSTKRVGFHQYRFPKGKEAAIYFQLEGDLGPSKIIKGSLTKIDDRTIIGQMANAPTIRRPKEFNVYFTAKFNNDIKYLIEDKHTKNIMLSFGNSLPELLKMKVAISYTSVENALDNLVKELNHWDFQKVVADSKNEWDVLLSRIIIEGGTEKEQSRFYTDLWHCLQGRRTINDINGAYPDNTGSTFRIGQLPVNAKGEAKFSHFNSDGFYGNQWTINTLWGLVYPDIYEQFVNSLLVYYKDGGLIPRGPSGGNYTYVMSGSGSTPFIVSAYQKGIKGFDADLAYNGLKKNHMPGGMMGHSGYEHNSARGGGIEHYIQNSYVPYPLPEGNFGFHEDGAGQTLEYAYQDWTLAQFAKALNKLDDYNYFMKRSENYKNLFDQNSGWIRPKDVYGKWRTPFDPYEFESGFIEANGAQFTWYVPHDLNGLAELMGGKEKAVEKLNKQFMESEELGFTAGTSHAVETHPEYRRIPINYGNQLSMQTAFIFNYLERPDLTQYWSRKITKAVHSGLSPETGYNGDEDQGLMGTLSILMKIGLFQMNGGTEENPTYDIGSPIFDKVTIKLNQNYYTGENFVIKTINNSSENFYVKQIKFNNRIIDDFKIHHNEIVEGGELVLEMTKKLH